MLGVWPVVKRYVLGTQGRRSVSGHQADMVGGAVGRGTLVKEGLRSLSSFPLSSFSWSLSCSHNRSEKGERLTHNHTGKSTASTENWVLHEGTESRMWECFCLIVRLPLCPQSISLA